MLCDDYEFYWLSSLQTGNKMSMGNDMSEIFNVNCRFVGLVQVEDVEIKCLCRSENLLKSLRNLA